MKTINLHIYPTNIKLESRILKETASLAKLKLFDNIIIVGIREDGDKESERLDDIREIRLISLKTKILPKGSFWKVFNYIEWFLRIILTYNKENIKSVNCHVLSVLPLGIFFKIFKNSKVIYDTHELETETEQISKARKLILKIVERRLINHVDGVIVVSDSIADWYKTGYKLKQVDIVRNIPYKQDNDLPQSKILKDKFNIRDNEMLFIFQGVLSKYRGVDILLNVFSRLDAQRNIVFMGYGPMQPIIKTYEERHPNIHFQPAVSQSEVAKYTSSADVGLSILENTCLSIYYSLPNKLFEYIVSGLPVIISDLPEMAKIVDDNDIGWKVPVDEESIIKLIKGISLHDIAQKKRNVLNCRDQFNWETEEKVLKAAYNQIFK